MQITESKGGEDGASRLSIFFGVFGFWSVMRNKCIEERNVEEKESRISNNPLGGSKLFGQLAKPILVSRRVG